MRTMAGLLADFIIEESAYVNANLDDFTWEGVDIYAFDKDGKQCGLGFTYSTMEDALTKKTDCWKSIQRLLCVTMRQGKKRPFAGDRQFR